MKKPEPEKLTIIKTPSKKQFLRHIEILSTPGTSFEKILLLHKYSEYFEQQYNFKTIKNILK